MVLSKNKLVALMERRFFPNENATTLYGISPNLSQKLLFPRLPRFRCPGRDGGLPDSRSSAPLANKTIKDKNIFRKKAITFTIIIIAVPYASRVCYRFF